MTLVKQKHTLVPRYHSFLLADASAGAAEA